MIAESTPLFAAFEIGIIGMSDEISMNARLIGVSLAYAGIGSAISKGRDLWRKSFNLTDKTNEKIQILHDTVYMAAFNLIAGPIIYYASGSRDLKEIAAGTALGIVIGSANGGPLGYAIDSFRDLIGTKKCERSSYPNILKNQATKTKKWIAAGLIITSLSATAGIYQINNDNEPENINQIQTEAVIN